MPKSIAITAPLRDALTACFVATTRLFTGDVDVAAPSEALLDIWKGVNDGALQFSFESDGQIAFDAPQGFRLKLDILEIGAGPVERIHVTEPLYDGSVASVSDLLLLRAVTVVDRGGDGDVLDFEWLLSEVVKTGQLPQLDEEELGWLVKAVESRLGTVGRLVVAAMLSGWPAFPHGASVIGNRIDTFLDLARPTRDTPAQPAPLVANATGEIADDTMLVALWNPQSKDDLTDRLLKSTATSTRYRRCYIETEDGLLPYAPDFALDDNKTNVFQFAKLLYTPVVRPHAQFGNDATGPRDPPYTTATIEFHFANNSSHSGRGVKELFIAGTPDVETGLTRILWASGYATGCLEPEEEHQITLHMCDFPPPSKAENASRSVLVKPQRGRKKNGQDAVEVPKVEHKVDPSWQAVGALLPGGSGHLLRSLYALECPFFRTQQGDMMIAPSSMPDRGALVNKRHPMMQMLAENTFASIEKAAARLAWHAEIQFTEQVQAFKSFCAAPHYVVRYGAGELAANKFGNFSKLGAHNNEAVFRLGDLTNLTMTYTVKTTSGAEADRPAESIPAGAGELGPQPPKDRLLEFDIAFAKYQTASSHNVKARSLVLQAKVIEQALSGVNVGKLVMPYPAKTKTETD
ncbi:hypothetical protein CBER1_10745 [Cercospora berteroae]|uniref:Uncharacterized protein n=1 Tax=Cercospora berteroae TaxID=357750 RepID=A0A2S6BY38_9PEZI|nr:hypothetical protein CBER1_10745 [Cercospora berteroae]